MDNYKGQMRNKAIAYYGATAGIGGIAGLILGGWIIQTLSWRIGFLINVPIAILVAVLALRYIPKVKQNSGRLDYGGMLLSIVGMGSLIYSIVGTTGNRWFAGLALLSFIGLYFLERRTNSPLLPLELFRDRQRLGAYIARFIFMGAIFSYWFLTPQIMQNVLGFSSMSAGLGFIPMSIPQFLLSMVVAKLTARYGNTDVMLVGLIFCLLGLVVPAWLNVNFGYWLVIGVPMVLLGIGQGLVLSPLTVAGVANARPTITGAASGLVNTTHQIGSSVGLSLTITLTDGIKSPAIMYQSAMKIELGLMVLAFIVVALFIRPVAK